MSRTKKITEPHYEVLYIVSNKYTEQETVPVADRIKKLIEDAGGKITYSENWGKKKLAYPINHFNHGYYFLLEFDLAGAELNRVDTEIKHMSEILRHQIVTKKKRTPEEIENEKRIIKKQQERAAEKKAAAEAEALKPDNQNKKSSTPAKAKVSNEEVKKEEKAPVEEVSSEDKKEEEPKKTKEEVKLNLDKLDEKLDKILDTEDLL